MKQKRNLRERLLVTVTLIFFGVTNTTWAQAPVPISLGQRSNVEVFLPANFTIPDTLGSVQPGFGGPRPDKPVVIVIQDAHGILDAQNNIQKIIHHLQTTYGIHLIALEGGKGKLDPTLFRAFPDEFIKKKIIEDYLRRGELTGSEMAAIFNQEEGIYYGIEDWDLYEENYLAYLRTMEKKENVLKQLGAVRENLDKERRQIYSAKLNEFHEQIAAFEAENKYLLEVLKYLGTLENTRERLSKYPEIEKLYRSFEFEEETSKKPEAIEITVRQMAESFKAKYLKKMNIKQEMSFHKNYQAFVTGQTQPADFLKYLIEIGESFGVKARLTPSLLKLLGHSQTLATIKGTELFRELENLLREIEESLITKPEERPLTEKFRQLNLLKDLVSLELTRDQWEKVQPIVRSRQSIEEPPKTSQDHMLWTMDSGLWTDFRPALEFYRLALERDQAFRKNLSNLLKEQKTKSAIVLAGGFHTEGFERNLKEDGISYAVITPKIQSLAGQETYQTVMQGNLSYKPYLRTTFYDAFVKDSTRKLANQWSEPDFRKNIKNWRDEVIRRLSKEGRIQQAKDYTRYIDLVLKVYHDKYGKVDDSPEARREILKALDKELKAFRKDTVNRLWQQFESQFKEFQPRSATLVQFFDRLALTSQGIPPVSAMNAELRQFFDTGQLPPETPGEAAAPLLRTRDIVDALLERAVGVSVPPDTVRTLAETETVRRVAGEIWNLGAAVRTVAPEAAPIAGITNVGREFVERIVRNVARDATIEAPAEVDKISTPGAVELAIVTAINGVGVNLGEGVNVTTGPLRAEVRSPGGVMTATEARLARLTKPQQARVPLSLADMPFYDNINGLSKTDKERTILRELMTRSPTLSAILGDIDIQPGLGPNELSFNFLDNSANKVSIPARNFQGDWIQSHFLIQTNPEGTEIIRLQASSPPGTASEVLRALVSYLKGLGYSSVPFVDLDKYPGSRAFLASTIGFWGADTNMPDSTYDLQLEPLTAGLDIPLISRLQELRLSRKEDSAKIEQISEEKEKEILETALISAKEQGISKIRFVKLRDPKNPENHSFFENFLSQWSPQPVTINRSASSFIINLDSLNLPDSLPPGVTLPAAGVIGTGRSELRPESRDSGTPLGTGRSELREKGEREPTAQLGILNNLARTLLPYRDPNQRSPGVHTGLYPALMDGLTHYLTEEPLENIQKTQEEARKEAQTNAVDESFLSDRFYRLAGSLKSLFFFWFQKKGATKQNPIQERLSKLTREIQKTLAEKRRTATQGHLLNVGQPEWGAGAAVLLAFAALVQNQNPGWVIYEFGQLRDSRDFKGNTIFPPGERGDFTAALLTLSRFWSEEEPRDEGERGRVLEEYQEVQRLTERQVTGRGENAPYLRETLTTLLAGGREGYQGIHMTTAATTVLTNRLREAADRLRALERSRVKDVSQIPVLRDDWNSDIRGTLTDIHSRWVSLSTQVGSSFRKPSDRPYPLEYGFAAALVELGTVLSDYRSVQGFGTRRADLEERQREAKEAEEKAKGTAAATLEALRRRAAFLYTISQRLTTLEIPNQVYRALFQRLKNNSPEGSAIYVNATYALTKLDRLDVLDPLPTQALVLQGASLESRTALRDEMQKNFWNILEKLPEKEADDAVRELERDKRVSPKQTVSPQQNFGGAFQRLQARVEVLSDALLRLQRLQLTEEEMKVWFDQNEELSAPEIERNLREIEASRRTLSWAEANARAVSFKDEFEKILANLPVIYRAVNLPDAVNVLEYARKLFADGLRQFQNSKREVFTRAARQDRNVADPMYAITVEDLKEGVVKVAQNVVDRIWRDNILYQMKVGEYNTGTVSATEAAAARNSLIDQAMALQDIVNQTSTELGVLLSTPSPAPQTAAEAAAANWQNNPELQQIRGATPGAENATANFNELVAEGVRVIPNLAQALRDETLLKDATQGTGAVSQQAQAVRQTVISVLDQVEQRLSRTDIGNLGRMAVVRTLMPLYRDPQPQIRNAAMTVLERMGVEAGQTQAGQRLRMSVVTTLSQLYLKSPYPESRRDAITALGDIANPLDTIAAQGNKTVVDLLMPHINDPVDQVQSAAILSVGQLLNLPETTNEAYVATRNKVIRSLTNLISNSTSAGEAFEAAVETLTQLEAPPEVVVRALTNLLERIDPEDIAFNERVMDLLTRVAEVNKDNPAVTGSLEILLTKRNSPSNARFGIFQVLDRLGRGERAIDELEASYQSAYDQYLSVGRQVEKTRLELNTTRQSLVETLGRIAGDRIATSQRRDDIANFLIGVLTPYQGTLRPQGEIEDTDVMVGAVEALGKIPISVLSFETYNNIVPTAGVLGNLLNRLLPSSNKPLPEGSNADKVLTAIEDTLRKFTSQTPPAPGSEASFLPAAATPPEGPATPGFVQPSVPTTDEDVAVRSEVRKVSVANALQNPLNLTGLSPEALAQMAVTNPLGITDLRPNARANLLIVQRRLGIGSRRLLPLFEGQSANQIILTIFEPGFLTTVDQSLGLGNIVAIVEAGDRLRGAVAWKLAELAGIVIPVAEAFEALPTDFQPMTPQALFLLSRPDLLQKILAKNPDVKLNERGAKVFDGRLIAPPQVVEEYNKDIAYLEKELAIRDIAVTDPQQIQGINDIFRRLPLLRRAVLRNNSPLDVKKLGIGFDDYVQMTLSWGDTKLKTGEVPEGLREVVYYGGDPYLREANLYLSALGVLSALALSNESVRALMQALESGVYRMTPNAFSALTNIVNRLALDEDVQQAYEAAA